MDAPEPLPYLDCKPSLMMCSSETGQLPHLILHRIYSLPFRRQPLQSLRGLLQHAEGRSIVGRPAGQRLDRHDVAVLQGDRHWAPLCRQCLLGQRQEGAQDADGAVRLAITSRAEGSDDQPQWWLDLTQGIGSAGDFAAQQALEDVAAASDLALLESALS